MQHLPENPLRAMNDGRISHLTDAKPRFSKSQGMVSQGNHPFLYLPANLSPAAALSDSVQSRYGGAFRSHIFTIVSID